MKRSVKALKLWSTRTTAVDVSMMEDGWRMVGEGLQLDVQRWRTVRPLYSVGMDHCSPCPSSGSRLRHTISRTARSPRRLSRISISCAHKTDLFPVVLMVELYAAWADRLRLRAARSSVDTASGCVIRGGRGERRY
jgi:hypothetical protein